MRRLKRTVAAFVCLTVMTSVATPKRTEAQFAVYDALNWIENALQVIQQAYEIYQKYMQLYNDYQRYATMVKNLGQFDEMSFRNLVGLAADVNDILQYGESLGHTLYDIDSQFAETFPGYEPILEDDWLAIFEHRSRRTLDTLRYSLNALNRIAEDAIPSRTRPSGSRCHCNVSSSGPQVSWRTRPWGSYRRTTFAGGQMAQPGPRADNIMARCSWTR